MYSPKLHIYIPSQRQGYALSCCHLQACYDVLGRACCSDIQFWVRTQILLFPLLSNLLSMYRLSCTPTVLPVLQVHDQYSVLCGVPGLC